MPQDAGHAFCRCAINDLRLWVCIAWCSINVRLLLLLHISMLDIRIYFANINAWFWVANPKQLLLSFLAIVTGDTSDDVYNNVKGVIENESGPLVWIPAIE